MGADMIGLGWTVHNGPEQPLDFDAALALVSKHRDAVIEALNAYNDDDMLEDDDERIREVASGLVVLTNGGPIRETVAYGFRIGDEARWFLFAGGLSWGDEPFEEFTACDVALEAALAVPEIAETFRFIGRGIAVD